ncbi:DUF6073 family protein [Changchengzhania lutea]|uniref:DUF6073 family protein n=1 Tax=Changchengzhania lutea TaxID=2049305 RepID=UPI00115E7886|nr:DUF6073 family protein [Changchengzhania lutea]
MDYLELGKKLGALLKGFEESYGDVSPKAQIDKSLSEKIKKLTSVTTTIVEGRQKTMWGNVVDKSLLKELFHGELAPKKHIRKQHPPAGIDHMTLETIDVFRIPEMGTFEVPFKGFFKIARSAPSKDKWENSVVYVNFLELKLFGTDKDLGDITVDLNPEVVSAGNTFPSANIGLVACNINVAARFHIHKLNLVLYNKTPIQLTNRDVQGIPTIGESGKANIHALPLYDYNNPHGDFFGYVEELNYKVKRYMKREEVELYRKANNYTEFMNF